MENLTFKDRLNLQKNKSNLDINDTLENLYTDKISFYLWGSAGTGKTEKVLKIAEKHNQIVKTMSVTPLSTKGEFYGFMSVDGKRYISTPFREAYEQGHTFLLDEMDNISQNLAVSLNQSLSQNVLTFPDKTIQKHENFRFLGTGNTNGMGGNSNFSGRQKLDFSFKDRFIPIEWKFNPSLELELSQNRNWTLLVQEIRQAIENFNIPIQCTMRASIVGSKILEKNPMIPILDLLEMTIFKYQISTETIDKILSYRYVENLILNLMNIEQEKPIEILDENFTSAVETIKQVEVKEISNLEFKIGSPDKIEEYMSNGFRVVTLDKSPIQKKWNLCHFDGQITIEKLQLLTSEKICFVTHTQEKKELIKQQLKGLGLL